MGRDKCGPCAADRDCDHMTKWVGHVAEANEGQPGHVNELARVH